MPPKKGETPLYCYLQSKQLYAFVSAAENEELYTSTLSQQLFPAFHFDRESSAGLHALPPPDFSAEFSKLGIQLGFAYDSLAEATSNAEQQSSIDTLASTDTASEFCKQAECLVEHLEKLFKTQAFDSHIAYLGRCETVYPAVKEAISSLAGVLADIDQVALRFARYTEQVAQLYYVVI